MKSRIFNLDWNDFQYRNPVHRKQLAGALQFFLSLPNKEIPPVFAKCQEFRKQHAELAGAIAKLQEFTSPADFPQSILPVIEKYHILPTYDTGFEQVFDVRDFTASGRNGFTMHDVQAGLTFGRVKIGEKIKVYQMSGTKAECYFDFYGGALSWHRSLFDDREFWELEDNAIEFRNKAYLIRAQVFYALIEAAGDAKSSCIAITDPNCTQCDAIARADATALNTAALTILRNVSGKGYGVDIGNTELIILAPPELRARLRQALAVNMQSFSGSPLIVDFRFRLVVSLMLQNQNRYYVILPKRKLKGGIRMDLSLFSDFDILSYSDVQAGWQRFGGCIGDMDQIECIDGTLPTGL
jgi:hypothetical protein